VSVCGYPSGRRAGPPRKRPHEHPGRPRPGIDLNEEAIAAHPYEARDLRHYNGTLTAIRPPDAAGNFKK
jgi:hypothetical protein